MSYTIGIDARKLNDFGIGTYIRNLTGALGRLDRENRYVLLVSREGREALEELPPNFEAVVEPSRVYSLTELVSLTFTLRRLQLDLYHATHYVLPAVVPCRAVATIHDVIHLLFPEFLPNKLALLYAQRMIRHTLARADRIITVSHNTKEDLLDLFGIDGGKLDVVLNGVEEVYRRRLPAADVLDALARYQLKPGYLLFVGNPKPHKNLDNVVKAFSVATSLATFDAPLVCVGGRKGSEFKIRQRAEQLGVGDRVHVLGEVPAESLPAFYQGAALFLYPTLYEGFGLPVVEAMASGVPVITSNNSALREIAEGYAYLVNPLDVMGLAQAIALCMQEPERRAALSELGTRRAADFSWDKAARATLDVYRRALGVPILSEEAA